MPQQVDEAGQTSSAPISEACEALAVQLGARGNGFDVAAAELTAAVYAAAQSDAISIVFVVGDSIDTRHSMILSNFSGLSIEKTPVPSRANPVYIESETRDIWYKIQSIFNDTVASPILVIAISLSTEDISYLNQRILSDADINGATLLGDAPQIGLSPSIFNRSWAIWRGDLPPDMLNGISRAFRTELGLPSDLVVKTLEPLTAHVEVVSLRTAVTATGGEFGQHQEANAIFDVHARTYKPSTRALEFAVFSHATVFPSASWKILTGDRLYVEEVGYVEHGRPHLVECWPEFGAYWTIRNTGPIIRIPATDRFTVLLGGDAAHYHMLLNWVPRLKILDNARVTELVGERPQIAISHRFSDKETGLIERLLGRKVDFVRLPEVGAYQYSNLIVPSFFSHHELTPAVADWYRMKLGIGPVARQRRIYISRADARTAGTPRRKVINETEVIACLAAHGFEAVELSNMSMDEQIALFSEVTFVVAPHGAGFANMVFTPPGAGAIVLENSWAHNFIADMLNVSGHRASILVCRDSYSEQYENNLKSLGYPDTEVRRSRDMIVDCEELVQAIEKAL